MRVDRDAAAFEARLEDARRGLPVEARDDDGTDQQAPGAQVVDELHGIDVVGHAEIGAHLLALDGAGVDTDDDLGLVAELLEETDLDVGIVAGQDASRVEVERDLAAELQIEPALDLADPFDDGARLLVEVLVVVEADCRGHRCLLRSPGRLRRRHCIRSRGSRLKPEASKRLTAVTPSLKPEAPDSQCVRSARICPLMPIVTIRNGTVRLARAIASWASRTSPPQHGTSMTATVSDRISAWSIIAASLPT